LAIDEAKGLAVTGASVTKSAGHVILRPEPSLKLAARIKYGAKTIKLLVLSQSQARQIWVGQFEGRTRLIKTTSEVSFDGGGLELRSMGEANFSFSVYPALNTLPKSSLSLSQAMTDGVFQTLLAKAPEKQITASLTQTRQAGKAEPIVIGGTAKRALQPYPEAFGRAAAWSISVPKGALDNVADVFLDIDYQGDVARLFAGSEMLDDDYYFGKSWMIGLKRFKSEISAPLTLTILPLRKDAPIYLDEAVKATLPTTDQVVVVKSVKLIPQYVLKLNP